MRCYLEQFDPAWHGQTVQLSAGNLNPDYVTPHLAKMLTVPRAIKSADGALGVNPLQYFACENGGGFMTVRNHYLLLITYYLSLMTVRNHYISLIIYHLLFITYDGEESVLITYYLPLITYDGARQGHL